ncbi:MAG: penicillin-binding protein 2 [Rickettsiales bacterium]|nr:penicillin-binding protein 2 [Rickettsiales bacterium]
MPENKIKKSRLIFIYCFVLIAFAVIILRMFFIVSFGDKVKISNIYDQRKLIKRANIIDRNGTLVATDLKTKSLYASSILIKDVKAVAAAISSVFPDLPYEEILKKITDNKNSKKWILLKRNLTPNQALQVQNLKIAGLIFEDDRIRVYPQKSITSHLVGYVDLDRKGLSGIEMQYDQQLAKGGADLQLALDIRVQDILHDELSNGMNQFNAKAAAGIIFDVTNGEVLAISSLPDFDPNLHEATSEQRFNRVVNGVYELGSIFKIFTNTIAFEDNIIKINDVYKVSEPIKEGRFTINDDHYVKDQMTVGEIFAYSSNIGTVQIAKKIGADLEKRQLEKFGLLKKIDAEFPGLGRPIYPKIWRDINLFTISYGHGIAITPMHIATTVGAIANGGTLYKPEFLKLTIQPSGKKIIKESTSQIMRQMMRQVVLEGTGRNADVVGYEVGGKTGTANRAELGSYNEKSTIASFVAVFPITQPKYLVYVIFDRPNSAFNTGGMVAAPVAGKIVRNIAPILGVYPINTNKL